MNNYYCYSRPGVGTIFRNTPATLCACLSVSDTESQGFSPVRDRIDNAQYTASFTFNRKFKGELNISAILERQFFVF